MCEIQIIGNEQGLMVFGNAAEIEQLLNDQGLSSRAMTRTVCESVSKAANIKANNGRWVKMTKESANFVKRFGDTGTGVVRGPKGRIVHHIKFEKLGRAAKVANPEAVALAMSQMAMKQVIAEVTDYLKTIDRKIDDLLQDQKDQAIADLVGIARMVDETMLIRDKVGIVGETAWSKISGCSQDIARAQSYALLKLKGLAQKLAESTDAAVAEQVAKQLAKDLPIWFTVLGNAVQLQNKMYVLELDRVAEETPDAIRQHHEGILLANKQRLHDIGANLTQLSKTISQSAESVREQKVWRPFTVDNTLKLLDSANGSIVRFAAVLDIEANQARIDKAPEWVDAAGKLISDSAQQIGDGAKAIGENVNHTVAKGIDDGSKQLKQLGDNTVQLGAKAGQTLQTGVKQIGDGVAHLGQETGKALGKGAEQIGKTAGDAVKGINNGLADAAGKLSGLFKR